MWGSGIIKGFGITMKNMFRPVITVQYPEQKLELPARSRWAVHQKFNDDGSPKCTACLICVKECPDDVLRLVVSSKEEGGKRIDAYVYEVGACMMCGLCVAACPFDAIEMSHEYELATRDHDDLVRVLLRDVDAAGPRRTPREGVAATTAAAAPAADPTPTAETGTEAADA
jgi:NADH-quinone oxidoreductase subunit I